MSKLPAFQFYPGDWRKDPNLSRATLAAKGAMIEIMCLAFECEKKGVLKTGGKAWTIDEIAMAIGGDLKTNKSAIFELLEKRVLKKDRKGAIFSSRMCKDEAGRLQNKKDGHMGGNPKLAKGYNEPGFLYAVKRASDGAVKIGIAKNVKNRFYKLQYSSQKDRLKLLKEWSVNDMGKMENIIHKMFEDKKVIGEWFKLNELDLLEINSTLMGNVKGNQRASSSSSSSYSNKENNTKENYLWTDEVKLFYNDFNWKEKFCRDKNIALQKLEILQKEFISDLELKEDFKPLKELKNHFTNWHNLKKLSPEKNIQQPTSPTLKRAHEFQ